MIYSISGTQYRVQCLDGIWRAAVWCDCLHGPHWHQVASKMSKRDLLTELSLLTPTAI